MTYVTSLPRSRPVQIGILGPFEIRTDGGRLADVLGARLRASLDTLALDAGG